MSEQRFRYVQPSTEQGVLVLTLSPSRLEGDEMAQAISVELQAAVAQAAAKNVAINLEHVDYLTSANFRPFLTLRRHLLETGGRLALCNLSETVLEAFQVTRMVGSLGAPSGIFEAQPDVGAAVASLLRG